MKDKLQTLGADVIHSMPRFNMSLLVIATAQLMLVLDDTIANIALPSIQRELGVSISTLPWIINAYILAFGSLLLFGGRIGDLFGRRRVLRVGLAVFAAASLLGGLGVNVEMLVLSRGFQGLGAALIAPNALALIATTFPVGKPRNQAMAVYGAMSALGITLGVLLGGVLTALLSWRWVFFINVPLGLAVLAGTRALMEGARSTGKLDTPGATSGSAALFALAYSLTRAGEHGWSDALTVAGLLTATVLMTVFVWWQSRAADPLLPLSLFSDRNRSGSYAAMLLGGASLMGSFYLLTLYLQHVLHFSPLKTGLASLPFSIGIVLGAGISSKLVERLAPRVVASLGSLVSAVGIFWFSRLSVDSAYLPHVLPSVFLTSLGWATMALTMMLTAVHGVAPDRAGVASALVNMAQQIGAALGLAVFTTVSLAAANSRFPGIDQALGDAGAGSAPSDRLAEALTHGYTAAFFVGSGFMLLSALIVFYAVRTRRTPEASAAAPVISPAGAW